MKIPEKGSGDSSKTQPVKRVSADAGDFLRLLDSLCMKTKDIAPHLGVSPSQISNIRGGRSQPSKALLDSLKWFIECNRPDLHSQLNLEGGKSGNIAVFGPPTTRDGTGVDAPLITDKPRPPDELALVDQLLRLPPERQQAIGEMILAQVERIRKMMKGTPNDRPWQRGPAKPPDKAGPPTAEMSPEEAMKWTNQAVLEKIEADRLKKGEKAPPPKP